MQKQINMLRFGHNVKKVLILSHILKMSPTLKYVRIKTFKSVSIS
jgi:hypothetical protein